MTRESPMRTSVGRPACTWPTALKTARRNSTAAVASLTTMRGVTEWNSGGRPIFMLPPPDRAVLVVRRVAVLELRAGAHERDWLRGVHRAPALLGALDHFRSPRQ